MLKRGGTMSRVKLLVVLAGGLFAVEFWEPEQGSDPRNIYWSALEDVDSARYELALKKYVWLYTRSESIPAVKNSYYVGGWSRLAELYPPALSKLLQIRDVQEWLLFEGVGQIMDYLPARITPFQLFQGVSAIDRELDDSGHCVAVYRELEQVNQALAKRVHAVAREHFILQEEFELFLKHIDADQEVDHIIMMYETAQDYITDDEQGRRFSAYAKHSYTKSSCTLVAVLVKTGDLEKAERISQKCSLELPDPDFQTQMAAALRGELPTREFDWGQ